MSQRFRVLVTSIGRSPTLAEEREALDPIDARIETIELTTEDAYIAAARTADALVSGGVKLNARVIDALERCKIIAAGGIGTDSIDLEAATRKGIVVTNVPDIFVEEVANHAMMLILSLAKKTMPLDRAVRESRWHEPRPFMKPMPRVTGDTLGLVAFGNIPRAVTRRARGFGMAVLAWDPFVAPEVFEQHGVERVETLTELCRRADFVSAHLPYNPKTHHAIGAEQFRAMKPTAYFVNTGRGGVVDEAALIRALQEGRVAGAGLDVFEREPPAPDNPLLAMVNVVLTPHSASLSDVANVERRRRVGQEIAAILTGRMPRNVVNKAVLATLSLTAG